MPKQPNPTKRRQQIVTTRTLAIATVALIAALVPVLSHPSVRAGQLFEYFWSPDSLSAVTDGITRRYGDIEHITTEQLETKLADDGDVVLVDVREISEYRISHLKSAVHAAPGADAAQLRPHLPADLTGKTVVFYCSVGERSSRMAQRMKDTLMSQGARQVYNLSGGIFAWHNEKRSLVDAEGSTDYVHPFDSHWGRLVDRQNLTRMAPKGSHAN